ncbi:GNAT family N-acetyltransferase [Sulfurihydrogenibium sp.]|uniref:GNAT family N-acetyltransferase n=1 Tax=Sulfurihydrogenibium sp. TaxID=2053621 RepID=UPI00262FC281|nr:GNAT family N-acetyltransferase [Sulfurihydrogenibium sp.]
MYVLNKIKDIKSLPIKAYKYRIKNFRKKITVNIETNSYIVKTAESTSELLDLLKLRFEVFLEGKKKLIPVDFDEYDLLADHLMIVDKKSGKPVGTYRLISSTFSKKFYSESEFYIENIKKLNVNLLEMGRAAIKKEHRNGITIALLWKGISEYVKQTESKYLFGCSSVYITDPLEVSYLYLYLRKNYFNEKFFCDVKPEYKVPNLDRYIDFLIKSKADTESASEFFTISFKELS